MRFVNGLITVRGCVYPSLVKRGLRLRGGLQEPWGLEGSHGFQGCCKPFLNPCWLQFYIFC